MCITQAVDIFGTGIVAGAFVMGAIGVHPAAARLDASTHVLLPSGADPAAATVPAAVHAIAGADFDCCDYALPDICVVAARCTRNNAGLYLTSLYTFVGAIKNPSSLRAESFRTTTAGSPDNISKCV
jgi:hypothetical protein